jgi:hypothetical protein
VSAAAASATSAIGGKRSSRDRGQIWFAIAGAVVGVALGIVVSVVTDVPFAPEAGLLIGGLVGWFLAAGLRR